ncbi:hypothetical protein Gotur_034777, partial [Gossypium turneri]
CRCQDLKCQKLWLWKFCVNFQLSPLFVSTVFVITQALLVTLFILTEVLSSLILKLMTTNSYDLLLFLLLIVNVKLQVVMVCPKLSCILLNAILGRKFRLLIIDHSIYISVIIT